MLMNITTDKYSELRPCLVHSNSGPDKPGFFHCWTMYNGSCIGLVEDPDGCIHTVTPWKIRFLDDPGWSECAVWETNEESEEDDGGEEYLD